MKWRFIKALCMYICMYVFSDFREKSLTKRSIVSSCCPSTPVTSRVKCSRSHCDPRERNNNRSSQCDPRDGELTQGRKISTETASVTLGRENVKGGGVWTKFFLKRIKCCNFQTFTVKYTFLEWNESENLFFISNFTKNADFLRKWQKIFFFLSKIFVTS